MFILRVYQLLKGHRKAPFLFKRTPRRSKKKGIILPDGVLLKSVASAHEKSPKVRKGNFKFKLNC